MPRSPALQRFDQLLEQQRQSVVFLQMGEDHFSTQYDPVEGEDFLIKQVDSQWRWESCGEIFLDRYCSEEDFYTEREAISDAVATLSELYQEETETLRDPDIVAAICQSPLP